MTTTAASTPDESPRGLGLAGTLEIVRRRRALALLPFLFVLTAAASIAFFLPGLWTARAVILVDRQQIPETYVKSTVTSDLDSRLLTLSQQILNRDRLFAIADRFNLYPRDRSRLTPDELVDKMRRDIRVETIVDERDRRARDARSIAFSVSYTASDPQIATEVANTLASLYIEANTKLRGEQAAGTSSFLEAQLKEVRERLRTQERRIADYKEKNLGELPEQREANLRTLDRLQQQLQIAHENSRRANERRQLLTQTLADIDQNYGAGAGGRDPSPAEAAAARLALLKQELAAMQTKYNDKYPDVIQMKEQIRVLEAKVAEAPAAMARTRAAPVSKDGKELRAPPQNAYVASLMTQLDQATVEAKATSEEIAALNRQIATYTRRVENMPKREQELALITRDYETTRELFRSLLAKRGEADIAADLEVRRKGETFRVIEPASLPDRPVGPNRMRMLLVGLVLALGASGLAVVLAENVDTSYRRVDEVRATVPVPVLSTIPKITTERDRLHVLRQRRLATAAVAAGLLLVIGSSFAVAYNNQSLVSALSQPAGPKR